MLWLRASQFCKLHDVLVIGFVEATQSVSIPVEQITVRDLMPSPHNFEQIPHESATHDAKEKNTAQDALCSSDNYRPPPSKKKRGPFVFFLGGYVFLR